MISSPVCFRIESSREMFQNSASLIHSLQSFLQRVVIQRYDARGAGRPMHGHISHGSFLANTIFRRTGLLMSQPYWRLLSQYGIYRTHLNRSLTGFSQDYYNGDPGGCPFKNKMDESGSCKAQDGLGRQTLHVFDGR